MKRPAAALKEIWRTLKNATMTRTVGIFLFDEVEVLDFAGPFEVFSTASRVHQRLHPETPKPFQVVTIAEQPGLVSARANLRVQADFTIDDHPLLDVLIVPGGVVTEQRRRPAVIEWIQQSSANAELTASVCTGAFLLAEAGLLSGREVTTHWGRYPRPTPGLSRPDRTGGQALGG